MPNATRIPPNAPESAHEVPLAEVAGRVISSYMQVQAGESLAIIVDDGADLEIGNALYAAGLAAGADAALVRIPMRAHSGAEPSSAVAALMAGADVVVSVTKRSLYHTRATGQAKAAGTRGAMNAPSTLDAWTHGAMTADHHEIRKTAERVADRLRGADRVRVTSPAGTDLELSILGRDPKAWLTAICRNPGEISAFPGGEVSLPPLEGTTNGLMVLEYVMTDLGALSEPIRLEVVDGLVTTITGGPEAERLEQLIEGVEGARNIGELGIGLNPLARLSADITESKKRAGTAHMAIGDHAGGYGGVVECDLHLDGMLFEPTIIVDGEPLMVDGELQL
jgi:leucyl aminopeptidase (aminopeptidase T)